MMEEFLTKIWDKTCTKSSPMHPNAAAMKIPIIKRSMIINSTPSDINANISHVMTEPILHTINITRLPMLSDIQPPTKYPMVHPIGNAPPENLFVE